MRRTLALMSVLIASTGIFAAEIPVDKQGEQVASASTNSLLEKNKGSLIKQSTKKADIDEEVDAQALKLGGIHRREDARQYLELKNEIEERREQPDNKTKNQKETSNMMTNK
ncbi:hypothetical protein [Acinetobacter genomosp. 15BJ]|uniref:Uncharacterized protein n=1 Tax=Acinetobacter genomosp. 15BJ TaxID=106651 RepID=R9B902_9GAMM|nr:hypothetical protein [Acinetobacter genomosp. 15BJ]EOR08851.1 hypothetical protein F896_01381 [Acinetobacter genomosp. 15BJ]MCH7293274.1 hypothetical protein [Acinetobacter genomosp. 15BJ]MDO3658665.1 hypothetical protein [Acinetobacter genomosp. 15BJ]